MPMTIINPVEYVVFRYIQPLASRHVQLLLETRRYDSE